MEPGCRWQGRTAAALAAAAVLSVHCSLRHPSPSNRVLSSPAAYHIIVSKRLQLLSPPPRCSLAIPPAIAFRATAAARHVIPWPRCPVWRCAAARADRVEGLAEPSGGAEPTASVSSSATTSAPLRIGLQADGSGLPKQAGQRRRRQKQKAAPQQEEQQEREQQEQEQQPTGRRRKQRAPKQLANPAEEGKQQRHSETQSSSSAAAGEGEPPIDRRRLPKSAETRRKMSEAHKATLERLGGFSPEWRTALSEAASRRRWGLDVRYRMSVSHRNRSPDARANMAAAQRRRRERERAQREAGAASRLLPSSAAAQAQAQAMLNEGLARERAVIELSRLRRELAAWLPEFAAQYGRVPVAEMERANPEMYAKYVRFTNLRNAIREWGSSGQK